MLSNRRSPFVGPGATRPGAFLFVLLLLLHAGGATPARAGIQVWVEPSTSRVFREDPPKPSCAAEISAARNESEAIQLVVHGGNLGLVEVTVVAGDLTGPGGAVIPASRFRLYREHYVRINRISFLGGALGNPRLEGWYPDPLIPFFDPYHPEQRPVGTLFKVPRRRNQPVWVELSVPEDAPPGRYTGRLTVTARGQAPVRVDVRLRVWDFAIPRERSVNTAYGFSYDNTLSYHGGPDGAWDEESLRVLHNYENVLHDHRVDLTNLGYDVVNPFGFNGEGNLLPVDWSNYDAQVGPRLDGSHFSDGIGARRFNAGFFRPGSTRHMETGITDDQYMQAAAAFSAHLREKGWLDRAYIYVQDEPFLHPESYERIVHDVGLMKQADPDWAGHFLVTNWYLEELAEAIDIWVPDTSKYGDWFLGFLGVKFPGREDYARLAAQGKEFWFYVCNCTVPPYAGYDIDTRLGYEPRIMLWGAWYEGASGFLYWRTNRWVEEAPWTRLIDPQDYPLVARNGDGFLLYPGDHDGTAAPAGSPPEIVLDGPVPSLRLKATRDGMEDWEMFLLASRRAGEDRVREIVSRAYHRLGTFPIPPVYDPASPPWTYRPEVIRSVREEVAALLSPPETSGAGTSPSREAREGP